MIVRAKAPFNKAGWYALRDAEGYFWKWIRADRFNELYESITS
jgi:hypothetical protein